MKFKKKSFGFTLVELLVTVAIIAILSAIGLVVYTSVLKQGRDAKRISDLRLIQSALNQYYIDQRYYPYTITFGSPLISGSKTYLNTVPTGTPAYVYEPSGTNCATATPQNCTNYCLKTQLDVPPNPSLSFPSGCTQGTNNFFVSPP